MRTQTPRRRGRLIAWCSCLVGLGLAAQSAARAGELTDSFARAGLVKPLDAPGQSLEQAVSISQRQRIPMRSGGECWHFAGTSRATGTPVVGVQQRWRLPVGLKASPAQVVDLIWRGGTVGSDGEGPRFTVDKIKTKRGWKAARPGASILAPNFGGALVRVDNIRPVELTPLYNRMGGELILDKDRVRVGAGFAEFELQAINPQQTRSAFPGSQFASMRIGVRRVGDALEVYKEYIAQKPEDLVAVGAPKYKPVSAALSMWNALPACFRKLTPMGLGTELSARFGAAVADVALGSKLREMVLDRHSRLFDQTFFPNLRTALERSLAR